MIFLFTDFGDKGPYIGQMTAKLRLCGFTGDIVNLFSDAPAYSVKASAYLLHAYSAALPKGSLFLSVVDPGVGGARKAVVVKSNDHWFVGPDNGLFELVLRKDTKAEVWEIVWIPEELSSSFHGRDLFAPIAAHLMANEAKNKLRNLSVDAIRRFDWPDDLSEIIYIDHYGNLITGQRAGRGISAVLIGGQRLPLSRTFSSVPIGEPLAYENSSGLIEVAVNKGRADQYFGLSIGSPIGFGSD